MFRKLLIFTVLKIVCEVKVFSLGLAIGRNASFPLYVESDEILVACCYGECVTRKICTQYTSFTLADVIRYPTRFS
jgi:hypothetical protein